MTEQEAKQSRTFFIIAFSNVDPSRVCTPIHQERLDVNASFVASVSAQGNELVILTTQRWLEVYELDNEDNSAPFNSNSELQMSEFGDDGLIPNWYRTSVETHERAQISGV